MDERGRVIIWLLGIVFTVLAISIAISILPVPPADRHATSTCESIGGLCQDGPSCSGGNVLARDRACTNGKVCCFRPVMD